MKMSLVTVPFLIVVGLTCSRCYSQELCAEDTREASIARAVQKQSNSQLPLQVTQLPHLTDTVITLETRNLAHTIGAEVDVLCFYKVEPASYQLKDNKIVGQTVQLDNYSEWLVVLALGSGAIYTLEGSVNPTAEFNRLVKDLRLRVTDSDTALSIFNFFHVVTGKREWRPQVVGDEMQLESIALEDFRLRYPANERKVAFRHWWNGVSATIRTLLAPPKASPVKDHFEVQYFGYSEGSVSIRNVIINVDGTVAEGESKVLLGKK